MKTSSVFFLVGLLVLGSLMSISGAIIPTEKPGLCPVFKIRCLMMDPPNRCIFDYGCPGNQKCCEGPCGRDCFLPIYESSP